MQQAEHAGYYMQIKGGMGRTSIQFSCIHISLFFHFILGLSPIQAFQNKILNSMLKSTTASQRKSVILCITETQYAGLTETLDKNWNRNLCRANSCLFPLFLGNTTASWCPGKELHASPVLTIKQKCDFTYKTGRMTYCHMIPHNKTHSNMLSYNPNGITSSGYSMKSFEHHNPSGKAKT